LITNSFTAGLPRFSVVLLVLPNKGGNIMRKEKLKNPRSATEKHKKNGGCIAEGELGDAVTVSV
jgi:hypothetical protein